MGLGRSRGLDGTDVDSSRTGSVGRQVVQLDGQGLRAAQLAASLRRREGEPGSGGRGPRDGEGVRAAPGSEPGKALADTEGRQLSSAGDSTSVDTQAGQSRETPAGDSDGPRPGGASGAPGSAGADLRAGLRGAQLRVPSESRLQGCAAPGRYLAKGRLQLGGRCRPEKLF